MELNILKSDLSTLSRVQLLKEIIEIVFGIEEIETSSKKEEYVTGRAIFIYLGISHLKAEALTIAKMINLAEISTMNWVYKYPKWRLAKDLQKENLIKGIFDYYDNCIKKEKI